ncbi:MAG: hypothetical protein A2747_00130 [Candidatus Yonathbacteria bacterium RIFCSPHIGHO2_01_FULL_44_41]|uniref:Uncharacterized protein n=1 Tax=Candidatus Yonathbacteria bacterium RIFCSPHIGHO2_02_FULL_44_14 TaxID=1802724 RepID=A0A1G2S836_9BACT|nr:MAG: hypothetical protein A2747_00130 [Candidatus Yonathbacteria bacterium RIFCSPHIGHO2_01_FULL_44_41]OHA81156.1 MAG: hypothetical protein A3B06_00195 [Candidatus Yonathbacteria bacterium RIFCSPLOWO2_01_FULL_43_20]OHA81226.1 MAG: hypothetical protein A3D51_01320 [Candidatus Yonathbacteria bacterium RIFCSPHIGHO2_02_FULL_44_14]
MKKATAKTKKVTIDDLARMMSKGFGDINKKFGDVNKMIAEGREETSELARMVARGFESVDRRFEKVEKEISEVKDNLASTRGDVLAMGDRFTLKYEFYDLSTRVGILEQKGKGKAKK